MDIEFIEEKDRDNVFRIMEMCGVDMSQAYQLYLSADSSVERALQLHFNEGPSQKVTNQSYGNQGFGYNNYQGNNDDYDQNGDEDQFDILYQKYKAYKNSGATFGNRYQIRKSNSSFLGGLVPKMFKGQPESNFKKLLQNFIGRTCAIKFSAQSLSYTLAQSQKFPVIVYILDFSAASKQKIQQTVRSNQIVQMVNVQFKNVGIDPNYEIEKKLVQFVDRKKFNNCLIVLRVNAVEEIQTISHISIMNSSVKEILEKLKLAKNQCISKDLDDGHLDKRLHQELMGNYDYQKPMSIAERRKVAQDRQIRRKQEQQFFASMKNQEQKQKNNPPPTNDHQNKPTSIPSSSSSQAQKNQPKAPEPPKRNIEQQRKQLRQKLKIYTTGMNIKLRLPNGEATILTVDPNEKTNYLFDYVMSIQKDIGFQKDTDRKFDIIRPYDHLHLSANMGKTLKDVFEGSDSQNLVVSQLD